MTTFEQSEDTEQRFSVVSPIGPKPVEDVSLAPRPDSLDGKVVAEVWDYMFDGDSAFPVLREELGRRFPGTRVIDYSHFGNIHGPDENKVVATLPDELRLAGVDAVVLGIGN
jgi:hypothetical protein